MYRTIILLLALAWAGRATAQFRSSSDSLHYISRIDSSFTLLGEGKLSEAERCLSEAIAIAPKLPTSLYLLNNLAGLQQMQGKTEAAILSYSAALERLPEEQTIRFNRARLYALSGKHEAAITDYSILIAQAPKSELYLYQRAMSYMLGGQNALAEADLSRLLDLNSESLKARLGYALLKTAEGKYDEAERLFDYLASKLAHSPEVYEGRARLYHARKMRGYALRDIDKAFSLSGSKPSATLYRLRAEIRRSVGDEASAKQDEALARSLENSYTPTK